jgi:hypothetical protein
MESDELPRIRNKFSWTKTQQYCVLIITLTKFSIHIQFFIMHTNFQYYITARYFLFIIHNISLYCHICKYILNVVSYDLNLLNSIKIKTLHYKWRLLYRIFTSLTTPPCQALTPWALIVLHCQQTYRSRWSPLSSHYYQMSYQ